MKLFSVYAIGSREYFVKFGIACDVERRLEQISVLHPYKVELFGSTAGMPRADCFALEWLIHRALFRFHYRGEWFKCCPATLAAAKLMTEKPPADLLNIFADRAADELKDALDCEYRPTRLSGGGALLRAKSYKRR